MPLVDTSVLVAWFHGDPRLEPVPAALDGPGTIAGVALAELASLEARGHLPDDTTRRLAGAGHDDTTRADLLAGGCLHGRLRSAGHPKVSLAGCIMLAQARRLGEVYVTLDRDLEGQEGVAVV